MSSKINLQTCEYARKSSIFQDNQLIYRTSVSILIGLSNTPLMKKINSTRASKELQYRYKENLLVGLALIIVSVLIGTNTEDKVIPAIVFYSYVWIIGAYLISTVTVCWYLLSIIDLAPKSERTEEEKKPGAPKGKYRIGKDGIS